MYKKTIILVCYFILTFCICFGLTTLSKYVFNLQLDYGYIIGLSIGVGTGNVLMELIFKKLD
jgi:hypothetical protein